MKSDRLRRQHKAWKKDQERAKQGQPALSASRSTEHHRSPITFLAPAVLSFLDDPQAAAEFFTRIQGFNKRRDIFVDLSVVRQITPDAIAVLLALVKFLVDARRVNVSGSYPDDAKATDKIRESGFDQYVRTSGHPGIGLQGEIVRRDLLMTSKKAEASRAKQLIDFAAGKGNRAGHLRLKPSYGHLLECMANTHQHAGPAGLTGKETWWASVYRDRSRHCDCFTFIDMGVGIFRSLEMDMRLKLYNLLNVTRPAILKRLLRGEIPSSTGKKYRGRGLPGLFESFRCSKIARLTIITNDVLADVQADRFTALPGSLKGVLLYWEVPHGSSREDNPSPDRG